MIFRIGDFARLSRVPVKTLRYYDEIGLLKPIGVDRYTRYRYYAADQLVVLNRILSLKELGFSLEQIGQLLESDLSPEQLRRMLLKRRREIEGQIEGQKGMLRRIEQRLKEIDQQGRLDEQLIVLKTIDPLWVAAAEQVIASYTEAEDTFAELFALVHGDLSQRGVRSSGLGVAIYHDQDADGENVRIEAAIQLPTALPSSAKVRVYQLPALNPAACLIYQGPYGSIGQAYGAILDWTQANFYCPDRPAREVYLAFDPQGETSQPLIEIQIPVTKIKESQKMEPKIVQLDKFCVVGLDYVGENANNEIKEMWGDFNRRYTEIKNIVNDSAAYGLCYDHPAARLEYIAGFQVTSLEDIPNGMVGKEVPAQTYVVFPCQGLENIGKVYQKIIHEWLPESGYVTGGGPDFEYYDEEFDPQSETGTLYIYFPIKKA